jgi:nucleotide-binding universal stress UspA family protein
MDGSEQAEAALEYAAENHPEADITVLHAYGLESADFAQGAVMVMNEEVREAAKKQADEIFESAREIAADAGHEGDLSTVVEEGKPGTVIPEHADGADAVFMGSHGREGPGRILLGSVAETVVRRAPVPVMVVK